MSVEFEKIASEGNSALIDELEKFASENDLGFTREDIETAVNSEIMDKMASITSLLSKPVGTAGKDAALTAGQAMGKSVADTVGKGLAAFGVGLGLTAGVKAFDKGSNMLSRRAFDSALDEVKRTNSIVRDADQGKVERFANTIHRFAPTASTDPNLLSSVLGQAVQYESIDQNTIKSLAELEGRMHQNSSIKVKDMMV